uniref:40S ribosomal protein S25 n=1 Tax=Heterorhabditis bacteriophora TaxID=37862 RepID=A0A1I7WCM6_HETBA
MSKLAGATARVIKDAARIRPTRAALTLTPEAVSRVKILLQNKRGAKALKVCDNHRYPFMNVSNTMIFL